MEGGSEHACAPRRRQLTALSAWSVSGVALFSFCKRFTLIYCAWLGRKIAPKKSGNRLPGAETRAFTKNRKLPSMSNRFYESLFYQILIARKTLGTTDNLNAVMFFIKRFGLGAIHGKCARCKASLSFFI